MVERSAGSRDAPREGGWIDLDAGTASGSDRLDEIEFGGSLLPAGLARFARTPALRWATRGGCVLLAIAAVIALGDAAVRRLAVIDGTGSSVAARTGAPTPFDRVVALAHQQRLQSNIRQASEAGECAPVAPGAVPEVAVLAVLNTVAPGVVKIDSARTLDQFTGLCSLQLRASAPGAVRVVVTISSPPAHPAPNTLDAVEVGLENPGPETVEYVLETMHTGWEILIGAVGEASRLPRTMDMTAAAGLPQLLW